MNHFVEITFFLMNKRRLPFFLMLKLIYFSKIEEMLFSGRHSCPIIHHKHLLVHKSTVIKIICSLSTRRGYHRGPNVIDTPRPKYVLCQVIIILRLLIWGILIIRDSSTFDGFFFSWTTRFLLLKLYFLLMIFCAFLVYIYLKVLLTYRGQRVIQVHTSWIH